MSRTYGTAELIAGVWNVKAEPHVVIEFKRVFPRVDKGQHGTLTLKDSPEICRRLQWFSDLYPINFVNGSKRSVETGAQQYRQRAERMIDLVDRKMVPRTFDMAIQPRDYQRVAGEIVLSQNFLLLADDVGLGKTTAAMCPLADKRSLPALFVCQAHLPKQMEFELNKFLPNARAHIIGRQNPYHLPPAEIYIITYAKLHYWAEVLAGFIKYCVFDEIQELRRTDSLKYTAAKHVARSAEFRAGLSATPIANYGGEMFNVVDVIAPDRLGTWEEFKREWCSAVGDGKWKLDDPAAFGTYLRDNFIMLRRTREELGRVLPPVIPVPHMIDSDSVELSKVEGHAQSLAEIIMSRNPAHTPEDKMTAGGQLNVMIRRATGVDKAPYVADFVAMLLESEPRLVLAGWHRDVYSIWQKKLEKAGKRVGYFTGSESPAQKMRNKELFIRGDIDVMFMSLRSGAGLNDLQNVCKVVVFGELDWSPAMHEQLIGRLNRDGQRESVTAYFLVSEEGSDPLMAEVLGIKKAQAEGIRAPKRDLIEKLEIDGKHVRRLAEQYLRRRNGNVVPAPKPLPMPPAPAPRQPRLQATISIPPKPPPRFKASITINPQLGRDTAMA